MKKRVLLALGLISLVLFFLMLLWSYNNFFSLDYTANLLMANNQYGSLTNIFLLISSIFEPLNIIILSFIITFFLLVKMKKKKALFFALTTSLGGILIYILKQLIMRTRPINSIILETGYSFPSGHALISVIFFGLIIFYFLNNRYSKIITPLCIMAILLIGFDRIYLNVHWLSDVLAGWFFGIFILFSSLYLFNTYKTRPSPQSHKYTRSPHHH